MALKDYIFETAFNPGTGPFAMLGPITGRKAFYPSFASGDVVMYGADDGTGVNWEVGWGVSSSGSPNNSLTRNVIRNSAGNISPINFTGTVEIICTIPADRALYAHPSGYIDARQADLRNFASVNGGSPSGQRNRILNPKMEVWQAGTSFATPASGTHVADGYEVAYDGSGSVFTVSRQDVTDARMRGMGLRRFLRIARTTGGSGGTYWQFKSKFESVYNFAGRTVVIGFWGRADTNRTVTVGIAQHFGTGGSPSTAAAMFVANANLTSTWDWYQVSATLPDIAGKTLGSNGDDCIVLVLTLPNNVISTFEFTDIHMMEGTWLPYTAAEPLAYPDALRRCQRHRCPLPVGMNGAAYATTAVLIAGRTPVPMFSNPTIDWSGSGSINLPGVGSFSSSSAPTVNTYDVTSGGLTVGWPGFSGLTVSGPVIYSVAPTKALLNAWLPG